MGNVTRDMASGTSLTTLQAIGTVTSTQTSAALDVKAMVGFVAVNLDSSIGTGTNPTLDIKIQESTTSGGSYTDVLDADGNVVQFTQVTDSAASQQVIALNADGSKGFLKAVQTLTGTTPSFTYVVNISSRPQVSA